MILILDRPGGRCRGLVQALESQGQSCVLVDAIDLRSMGDVRRAVAKHAPEVVVFAGSTEPARGNDDADTAFADNAETVIGVAAAALEFSAVPVLLSTSAVFGGRGPFDEGDEVNPPTVWSESRRRGETFLARANKDTLILRYGPLIEHEAVSTVPGSQKVRPISWPQLAEVLVKAVAQNTKGVLHCASSPPITRNALREQLGLRALPSSQGAPHGYRHLNTSRLEVLLGGPLGSWQEHVEQAVASFPRGGFRDVGAGDTPDAPPDRTKDNAGVWADDDKLQAGLLELDRGQSQVLSGVARHVLVVMGKVVVERSEHEDTIVEEGGSVVLAAPNNVCLMALAPSKIVWVGSKA